MSQSQQPPCPYCGAAVTFHQSSAFIYRGTDCVSARVAAALQARKELET